jgi:hypothetical protein
MTDNKINRALTKLAGDCWHELKYSQELLDGRATWFCVHCEQQYTGYGKLNVNIDYTESLDPTLVLAEKLGYEVVMVPVRSTKGIGVSITARHPFSKKLGHVENLFDNDHQRARRLALCEAILRAENKWEESK